MQESDNKSRLLQAAIMLFGKSGYQAVSIRQIADQAAVNSAMISYYFGSKKALYQAAITKQVEALDIFLKADPSTHSPEEIFILYARTLKKIHQEHPVFIQFIHRELVQPSSQLDFLVKNRLRQVFQILAKALQQGIEEKRFRADLNIPHTIMLWAGMVNFYYLIQPIRIRVLPDAQDDELYLKQATSIFLAGIERRPSL